MNDVTESTTQTGAVEYSLLLIDCDSARASLLSRQLSSFGYHVSTMGDMPDDWDQPVPDAIICMIDKQSHADERYGFIKMITGGGIHRDSGPFVITVSNIGGFKDRLQAAESGSNWFFSEPVAFAQLVEKLDNALRAPEDESYRVIVLDDQPFPAHSFAQALSLRGLDTRPLTDPTLVFEMLSEFDPDLLLTDLHMAPYDGFQVASVIRQDERFAGLPVVFLSSENTTLDLQLDSLESGGDEFLSKSIHPDVLAGFVKARARRARHLRSAMARDSMTGLLKHTAIKEALIREISTSGRQERPLSFALLDIDKFKNVNDTYGHSTGDKVIVALSRLLVQRLREGDIIGRYGGEEFAIVMPNTNAEQAAEVMDRLREVFNTIEHDCGDGQSITCSFSCGIAGFPAIDNSSDMVDAADSNLYRAKGAGRNTVIWKDPVPPLEDI